jgi:hypothetical protein
MMAFLVFSAIITSRLDLAGFLLRVHHIAYLIFATLLSPA